MNCCAGEIDQNEIMKEYVNPHLNNAGVPQSYTNAFSQGFQTGNYSGQFGQLAQNQFMNPMSQQLSGGNPFVQQLISNQFGSMAQGNQPNLGGMGGFGEVVQGISKKNPSGLVKSRLE